MTSTVYESGAWIYKMIITFVFAAICLFLIGNVVKNDLNTRQVQTDLLLARVLYSPDSIWLEQDGIVLIGTVDQGKFTQQWLDASFAYPARYGGARLTLSTGGNGQVLYVNKQWYDQYAGAFQQGITKGGIVETHVYPVVVRQNGANVNGILRVDIAMPERA